MVLVLDQDSTYLYLQEGIHILSLLLLKNKNQGEKDCALFSCKSQFSNSIFVTTYVDTNELVDKVDNQIISVFIHTADKYK